MTGFRSIELLRVSTHLAIPVHLRTAFTALLLALHNAWQERRDDDRVAFFERRQMFGVFRRHGAAARQFDNFFPPPKIGRDLRSRRGAFQVQIAPRLLGVVTLQAILPRKRLDAIQSFVEERNYSVVREYCGHGIGRVYHEDPQVLHYGEPGTGIELRPGMTFTVEPMVNAGKRHVKLLPDGWTVVTKDHSLSAQWEHTVLVTESGVEVLTLGAQGRTASRPQASAAGAGG